MSFRVGQKREACFRSFNDYLSSFQKSCYKEVKKILTTPFLFLFALTVISFLSIIPSSVFAAAPVAYDDSISVSEESTAFGIFNAFDSDGDSLTYSVVTEPSKGDMYHYGINEYYYWPYDNITGTDSFTFKVNDGVSDSNIATVSIQITNVNDPPTITSTPPIAVNYGSPYIYTITANDPEGDFVYYFDSVLPAWLSFDGPSGLLSGTPTITDIGNHDVSLVAWDGTDSSQQNFTVKVNGGPSAPVHNAPADSFVLPTSPTLVVDASTDPNSDNLSYSFEVSTSLDFGNIVASASDVSDNGSTASWLVESVLENNKTYYWRAKASDGMLESGWMTPVSFSVDDQTAPSSAASPAGGTYVTSQKITLTADEWGTIFYTTDGSIPTTSSSVYSAPIYVGNDTTLNYFAVDAVGNAETAHSDSYSISGGVIKSWGYNGYGELGNGITGEKKDPVQVVGVSDINTIADGLFHTVALDNNSTVWTWGSNQRGELGRGTFTYSEVPGQVSGLTGVIAIAAGGDSIYYGGYSLALKNDGTVWAWGNNWNGQLGDGTKTDRSSPVQVTGLANIIAIAAGEGHSLALKNDGTVWAWGYNNAGQLGDGTTNSSSTPVQVDSLADVVAIGSAYRHNLAVKSDGTVWAWGYNYYGQLGDGTTTNRSVPVMVNNLLDVVSIGVGAQHSLAVKTDGSLWAWGNNSDGQFGNGNKQSSLLPVQIPGIADVMQVAGGQGTTVILKSDGTVWNWGRLVFDDSLIPIQIEGLANVSALAPYIASHASIVKSDGTIWAWGHNRMGQLGNLSDTVSNVPVDAIGLDNVVSVAGGLKRSFALKKDGTVWQFGLYFSSTDWEWLTSPTIKEDIANVQSLSAGENFVLALKKDGTVWGWGSNSSGQLGDGTTDYREEAVQVVDISNAITVSAGTSHGIALKSDGTVWAWGGNYNGQLGDGTTDVRYIPVQVSGLDDVVAIAAGTNYSMAIKTDGSLWAWGYNQWGCLGDGTTTNRLVPVQVTSLENVVDIDISKKSYSMSCSHTLALKGDGTVWSWGYNRHGQLGDGTIDSKTTPVQVSGLSGVTSVKTGQSFSLALKNDGSIWSWGLNVFGQLGDGTNIYNNTVPVQVSGLSDADFIDAGWEHTLTIVPDPDPNNLPVADPGSLTTDEELPVFGFLSASDIDGDSLKYSIVSNGKLGSVFLNNSSTGDFTYTPFANVTGTDRFTFKANDGTSDSNIATETVTINNVNDDPVITSTEITSVDEDSLYSYIFTASDADMSDLLTYSAPVLPTWLNFSTTTGRLYGTPAYADIGDHNVTLRVNDGTVDVDQSFVITVAANLTDDDNDGVPDSWEKAAFGNTSSAAWGDPDADGLTNLEEYRLGTNPMVDNATMNDGDNDGLPDEWEIAFLNSTSVLPMGDSDGDGVSNIKEYYMATDPNSDNALLGDTDGDGIPDLVEEANGTDPAVEDAAYDPDEDGLTNLEEYLLGSGPMSDNRLMADDDSDGIPNLVEIVLGMNPSADNSSTDEDGDGIDDIIEYKNGTLHIDNLILIDSDGDSLPDIWEKANGLDPLVDNGTSDTDGDGLTDGEEYLLGMVPVANLPPSEVPFITENGREFALMDSVDIAFAPATDPSGGSLSYRAYLYEGFGLNGLLLEEGLVDPLGGYSPSLAITEEQIYTVVIQANNGLSLSPASRCSFVSTAGTIAGDVNFDGMVDGVDLTLLGISFGKTSVDADYNPFANFIDTGSMIINGDDLSILGVNFGKTR